MIQSLLINAVWWSMQSRILFVEKAKKVMIVGGGPAGLQAAETAAMIGHNVTVYEAALNIK